MITLRPFRFVPPSAAMAMLAGVVSALVVAVPAPAGAALESQSFDGARRQRFEVPDGICSVTVELDGAAGGLGGLAGGATPATGAHVTGKLDVTPNEVLWVRPGGRGGDGVGNALGTGGVGGFNGGGVGGDGHFDALEPTALLAGGGGGGGASDIRRSGDTLVDRVAIAAGGGGSGAGATDTLGGGGASGTDGDGTLGDFGQNGSAIAVDVPEGGGPGNFGGGGPAGVDAPTGAPPLSATGGSSGQGGDGGSRLLYNLGGGGGAGGLNGGGGGGAIRITVGSAAGGGGAASVRPPGGTAGPSVELDGQVTVSWDTVLDACGVAGELSLSKTVSTEPGVCSGDTEIEVDPGTSVFYCYVMTNNTNRVANLNDLVDDRLGTILDDDVNEISPGLNFAVISDAVVIDEDTVNTAEWTASHVEGDPPEEELIGSAEATATVTVTAPAPEVEIVTSWDCVGDEMTLGIGVVNHGPEDIEVDVLVDGEVVESALVVGVENPAAMQIVIPYPASGVGTPIQVVTSTDQLELAAGTLDIPFVHCDDRGPEVTDPDPPIGPDHYDPPNHAPRGAAAIYGSPGYTG